MESLLPGSQRADDARSEDFASRLGEGRPLDSGIAARMRRLFGRDMSSVRVHTDNAAAGIASELQAHAFTVGDQIGFASGRYKPGSPLGDALIAHELAHAAQQRGTGHVGDHALEGEADRAAVSAALGASPSPVAGRTGIRVQRCGEPDAQRAADSGLIDQWIQASPIAPWVGRRYRAAIPGGAPRSVVRGHLHVEGSDPYEEHLRQFQRETGRTGEGADVPAFTEVRRQQVHIRSGCGGANDVGTGVHESIHLFENPAFRAGIGAGISSNEAFYVAEGATEYFARTVLQAHGITRHHYDNEAASIEQMTNTIGAAGFQRLGDAYFDGHIGALKAAYDGSVGRAGAFAAWANQFRGSHVGEEFW